MSKLIPMACLPGLAGHGRTLPKIQQVAVSGAHADDTEARRLRALEQAPRPAAEADRLVKL
jgi:hypothetical protein